MWAERQPHPHCPAGKTKLEAGVVAVGLSKLGSPCGGGALVSRELRAADDPWGPKRPSVDLVTQAKLLGEASTDAQNAHEEDKAALLGIPSGVPAYDRFRALGCVWKPFRLRKT